MKPTWLAPRRWAQATEVESVLKAKADGKAIEVFTQATPTWEHVDFNLNVR